ncbi:MAG: hypothetical protein EXS37_08190 [Opitutus sp.]|nr:hypothetical protein [Opitutus sp.]
MKAIPRRDFLRTSALAGGAMLAAPLLRAATSARSLHLAPFRFDVTPPPGHSLCGGWIKPVLGIDDPLEAIGFVLLGAGAPIVICVVDWTGILNEAHVAWRAALAEAAGTTPDRVTLHTVHQHNAPLVCFDAERMLSAQRDLPRVFDRDFHRRCLDTARTAVVTALPRARPVTHVAHGRAQIEEVASNRRVARGADGRVTQMRGSSCKDAALAALPEGTIDPMLRTVAFFDRGKKIAACHYYATHPMSYYGDGRVSSDFCGLARKHRQQDEPDCAHLYFTGCAGNIAAGKYNDGSAESRVRLTERIYRGIVASEASLRPEPLAEIEWRTAEIQPAPNPALGLGALEELMSKQKDAVVLRMRSAFKLASIRRHERKIPFVLSALHLNDVALLHLPAEPFIEYQLRAQALRPGRIVATAAYGDCGPWYLPTQAEYPFGGYEVEHAFCAPGTEDLLVGAITRLLA